MDYELFPTKDEPQYETAEETRFTTPPIVIVFIVYCLLGIVIDILLIYIFLHFKRLFSVANIFLVNWCIADVIKFVVSPTAYFPLTSIIGLHYSDQYSCFVMDMEECFDLVASIFQVLIVIDWCVENFWQSKLVQWKENYKVAVVAVWAPLTFSAIISTRICAQEGHHAHTFLSAVMLLYHVAFPLFLLTLIIVRCVCKCRKRTLNSSNNLFYLICFIELSFVLQVWFGFPDDVFSIILEFCYNATPFLLLALLTIENPQFRTCFKKVFTCQFTEDEDYNRETLTGIYCRRCQETLL